VGLKSEGRVALKEFAEAGRLPELQPGDEVEVFLERMENKNGEAVLSRDKAKREEAWVQLEKAFEKNERVTGVIFGRVKGGFTVDLSGAVAFLPGSQVDIRPVRDIGPLMGSPQPFQILKMDRSRGNIVVSRRAVLEETRAEQRTELVANLTSGCRQEHHRLRRLRRPGRRGRASSCHRHLLEGMKQLEADPWEGVGAKYPIGTKFTGRVTNITDYGAFVELEAGIEGLVHVSEMSWTKKNVHPGKIVSTSQEVEVMVLDLDEQKRRISLGLKQCGENPWDGFAANYPIATEIEGEIRNITEFGLFVGLPGEIDGMVHFSDLSWDLPGEEAVKEYKKGDTVKVKVLDIDISKERISLGIKQLTQDPFRESTERVKKGEIVTCTVHKVVDNGIEVELQGGAIGFIRKAELSRDRSEQNPSRFAVGEKVDARVINVDPKSRKISLSIKQREIAEEKKAVAEYGSSESGASLGEILGAAFSRAAEEKAVEEPAVEEPVAEEPVAEEPVVEEKAAATKPAKAKAADKKAAADKPAKGKTKKAAADKPDAAEPDAAEPEEAADKAKTVKKKAKAPATKKAGSSAKSDADSGAAEDESAGKAESKKTTKKS
jgi:small subunit ribosomal protein S1